MKSYRVITILLAAVLLLSACSLPSASPTEEISPDAVFTAAAQTVEVQLTQNSLLVPTKAPATKTPPAAEATKTPELPAAPTNPPASQPTATNKPAVLPTSTCDAAQFINDITIPDGTVFKSGATFTKTWRLKNTGTCTWNSSYNLVFDSGEAMGGPASQPLAASVAPGETIDISVNMQAPAKDGTLRGFWGLTNPSGVRIPVAGGTNGKSFYVEIKVSESGNTATPGPSATAGPSPTPGGSATPTKFTVTGVSFAVARYEACDSPTGKYVIDAYIEANTSGTVTYTWIRSDAATGPENSGTLVFEAAGTKAISFEWTTTLSDLWMDLYVDKPNQKQFGRAVLMCP